MRQAKNRRRAKKTENKGFLQKNRNRLPCFDHISSKNIFPHAFFVMNRMRDFYKPN